MSSTLCCVARTTSIRCSIRISHRHRYYYVSTKKTSQPALAWYSKRLETHPLLTKGVTSGLIAGAGDFLCQMIVQQNDASTATIRWDHFRTGRFAFLGAALVAPACHYWYAALASWFTAPTTIALVQRVALDQFVFTPGILVSWLTCLWALEHEGRPPKLSTLTESVPGLLVSNWMLWIPAQSINFRFTPVPYQVLGSNVISLVWNTYLSYRTRRQTRENEPTNK